MSTADQRWVGCRSCDAKRISIAFQCPGRCGDLPVGKELLMVPELLSQDLLLPTPTLITLRRTHPALST